MNHTALIARIFTVEERDQIISILRTVESRMYQSNQTPFLNIVDSTIPIAYASVLKDDRRLFPGTDPEYVRSLSETLFSVQELVLMAGFFPSRIAIEKIHAFFSTTVLEPFFIDFRYDNRIIGGVIVVWKGKYLDLSLNKFFDTVSQEETVRLLHH